MLYKYLILRHIDTFLCNLYNNDMNDYNNLITQIKNIENREQVFNFLDVIDKNDNENIISNWLAFILDSKRIGSTKPFNAFCDFCEVDLNGSYVEIDREYFIQDNKKRLDIIIKAEKTWIVVENKINSFESNEQTKYYVESITKQKKSNNIDDVKYIYLKPNYNKSKPVDENFNVKTYSNLLEHFRQIEKADFTNTKYFLYFEEFVKIIKEKYAVDQELSFGNEVNIYISNREQFRIINQSFNDACTLVLNKLETALNQVFPDYEGWIINKRLDYIQFFKGTWEKEGIHFEIGIWRGQKKDKDISFQRIIANEVIIDYCVHAEGENKKHYFDYINNYMSNKTYFCHKCYDFNDEVKCIESINAIAEHLLNIKNEYTKKIDSLIITARRT